MTLILASSSPRRRQLLARLAPSFEVVPSRVVERPPLSGEDPSVYARRLAEEKASDVGIQRPNDVVLGADTVVAVGGLILGKPSDHEDAARMLRLLRGKCHIVVTAVVVRCESGHHGGAVAARVHMRNYRDDEIASYVSTGEPMDKAGAYAVQGLGGALVERVAGCYETVVGLPLCLTADLLRLCGMGEGSGSRPCCEHRPAI